MSRSELTAVAKMKENHLTCDAGTEVVKAGDRSRNCYTVFAGWAVRYHRLKAGTRQILDVLLPGDNAALSAALLGTSGYSVQAVTAAEFCVLDGRQVATLFETHPQFAADVLRSRLTNEQRADARLTMLGRLNAEERVGYFLVETLDRLGRRGLADVTRGPFPLRRSDVADAVGLSKVHVMRALRALRAQGLASIDGRELTIADPAQLAAHVGYVPPPKTRRAIL